jgi:hypothetical protein
MPPGRYPASLVIRNQATQLRQCNTIRLAHLYKLQPLYSSFLASACTSALNLHAPLLFAERLDAYPGSYRVGHGTETWGRVSHGEGCSAARYMKGDIGCGHWVGVASVGEGGWNLFGWWSFGSFLFVSSPCSWRVVMDLMGGDNVWCCQLMLISRHPRHIRHNTPDVSPKSKQGQDTRTTFIIRDVP